MDAYQKIRSATSGQRLGFLLKDAAVYGLATALTRLMAIITLPLLTRALSPEQYGFMDSVSVLVAVVVGFCTFGQDSAVARMFYDTEDMEERRRIVSQGLIIQLLIAVPATVTLVAGHNLVLSILYGSAPHSPELLLAVVSIPATVVLQSSRNVLKWTFARSPFVTLSVGLSVCQMLLVVGLVWGAGLETRGYFLALLITNCIFAALGMHFCRKYWTRAMRPSRVREMLAYGWPYMVAAVVMCLVPAVDRMCVISSLSLDHAGHYAVGFRIASLIMLPVIAFQTAWGPFCYALHKEPDAADTYSRILLYFTAVVALGAFALALVAGPVISLVARRDYLAGASVVLPLAFGGALQGVSWITGIGIDLSKKTAYSLTSYLIGLAVTLVAIWALVGAFGIVGVSVGVMLGSLAQCVSYTTFGYWCHPLRFRMGRPVAALATAGIAGCLSQLLPWPPGPAKFAWQAAWFTAIVLVLWRVVLGKGSREELKGWALAFGKRVRN